MTEIEELNQHIISLRANMISMRDEDDRIIALRNKEIKELEGNTLGDKQQIGDLLSICDMKDEEIKQLKNDLDFFMERLNIKSRKLEKIESKLKEIDSEEGHDVMFCSVEWIEEILRGKEE